jgi:hypothetical protein
VADWDVIGAAPAQVQDPWAVRSMAPAPAAAPATNPSVEGKETTEGPLGFANGIAELVGKGLGNMPMAAIHGIVDTLSRATGHGARPASPPTFPFTANAQSVGQGVSDAMGAAAAPYQNPVASSLLNSDAVKNYVAPVVRDVSAVLPLAGPASRVLGPLSDAIGPMGTEAGEAAAAAQAATPAGQLAAKGWRMRPSDVAKLTPGGQPTLGGGALQSVVGDQAAAQTIGPQNALIAQQKAASATGIKLDQNGVMTPGAIADAKAPHAAVYDQMAQVPGEDTPGSYTQALEKIRTDPTLAPETQAAVDKLVTLHADVGNSASASTSIKTLRQKGSNLIGNDNPDLQDRGYAMKGIAGAMEDVLEQRAVTSGQPELAAQFQQARKSYAQISNVDDASTAGMIDPQKLLRARNKGAPLTGGLADIADAAEQLPDVVRHQHAFSGGASDVPTTIAGAVQGLLRNMGGNAILKGPYQQSLKGIPGAAPPRPPPVVGASPAAASPLAGANAGPLSLADDLAGPATQSAPKKEEPPPVVSGGSHLIQYNGDTATPVTGAAAQANAGQGRIVIDTDTGRLVSSGNMPPGLALGLLNRWKAKKPLGQEF